MAPLALFVLAILLIAGLVVSAQSQHPYDLATPRELPRASAHIDSFVRNNDHGHRGHAHTDEGHGHGHDHGHGWACGHSRVEHLQEESVRQFREYAAANAAPLKGRKTSRRMSQNSGSSSATLRIAVEYQCQLSASQLQSVQRLVDTAVRVVQKFIQVSAPLQSPLLIRKTASCSPATISSSLRAGAGNGGGLNADFLLYVTSQSGSACSSSSSSKAGVPAAAGALAWAMACDYSLEPASFGRPTLAVINLCPGAVSAAAEAAAAADAAGTPITGSVVDVLVHELLHALGLSATLYPNWLDSGAGQGQAYSKDTMATSGGIPYLVTPQASRAARDLLQCSQLPGAPLEDQGGSGSASSHWEFRFFHQELMTPFFFSTGQRQRLSRLTLAALQDSGWYVPARQYAQELDLQQLPVGTVGCSLATSSCSQFQSQNPGMYYCNTNGASLAASASRPTLQCYTPTVPAACNSAPFSNGCGVLHPSNLACTATNVGALLPGTPNLLPDGVASAGSFYQGLGAYYGSDGACLSWSNKTGASYPGCFLLLQEGNSAGVAAVVNGAVTYMPCPTGTNLLLNSYISVKEKSTTLQCPSSAQAAQLSEPPAPGACTGGTPCEHGTCSGDQRCICELEYVGDDCSTHVSQVAEYGATPVTKRPPLSSGQKSSPTTGTSPQPQPSSSGTAAASLAAAADVLSTTDSPSSQVPQSPERQAPSPKKSSGSDDDDGRQGKGKGPKAQDLGNGNKGPSSQKPSAKKTAATAMTQSLDMSPAPSQSSSQAALLALGAAVSLIELAPAGSSEQAPGTAKGVYGGSSRASPRPIPAAAPRVR